MSVEQQLRDTFERYAEKTPAPVDAHATVLRRHRRSQRRRLVGGTVAVGLVFAVAIPVTVQVLDRPPDGVEVAVGGAGYVPGPPRGSLATDDGFLAEVVTVPWVITPDGSQPPIADRKVIFAGDVPGGRWARVVAEVDGQWQGVWLIGPVGAAGESLSPAGDADLDVTEIQVRGDFGVPDKPLVVLAAPGDQVSLSDATVVAADGTVSRVYRPVDNDGGVVVTSVPGGHAGALTIRVTRDGRPVPWAGGIRGPLTENGSPADLAAALDGARGSPDLEQTFQLLESVSSPVGARPADLDPQVLWGGPIDLGAGGAAQALVATTALPSGARAVVGGWATAGELGLGFAGVSLLELYPAGATLPTLVAMRCDVQLSPDGTALDSRLVIVAPPETVSVRVMAGDRLLEEVGTPQGGVGAIEFPSGADWVVALGADGEVLGEEAIGGVTDIQLIDVGSIG